MAVPSALIDVGPWGGSGAKNFTLPGDASGIKMVIVYAGDVVNGLEIICEDGKTSQAGILAGTPYEFEITNTSGSENINWVGGSFIIYAGQTCITVLQFKTNSGRDSGPLGPGGGTAFTLPITTGKTVGLFGQCNKYINSIGVSVAPY